MIFCPGFHRTVHKKVVTRVRDDSHPARPDARRKDPIAPLLSRRRHPRPTGDASSSRSHSRAGPVCRTWGERRGEERRVYIDYSDFSHHSGGGGSSTTCRVRCVMVVFQRGLHSRRRRRNNIINPKNGMVVGTHLYLAYQCCLSSSVMSTEYSECG